MNSRDFAFDGDRVIVVRVEPQASNKRSRARQGAASVLIGVAAARLAGRQIEGLLFGVDVIDPVSIAGAFVVLVLVATMAAVLPARGAAAVDPAEALRDG